ncbi:FMRFamide activated amiloride sensitive sodium [Echinococcus multilocularis]|uniref:FMRFamide activated amiloride sensitive sodium n=1 Tax=Echinococcus multilocularis TaxID=6211 RepID=A0A087W228_ECHMU|nr:FMRFamide activated amiloride sensitive sodium [Echinococcus multilocularis]
MKRFITRMYCSTTITRNMLAADTGCRAPCIRYSYDMQISIAQWPTKRFITNSANNQLHRKKQAAKRQSKSANFEGSYAKQEEEDESRFVGLLKPYAAIQNMTTNGEEVEAVDLLMHTQNVEQNFLSIIVSCPNFDSIRVEEKAVVTLNSLFSQIGGLLSTWVGITMICIVEVAEFLDVLCGRIPRFLHNSAFLRKEKLHVYC